MTITVPRVLILMTAMASMAAWSHEDHEHHVASAIGEPGQPDRANRSIRVDMSDNMRFTPSRFTVRRGETVRFIVHNSGKLRHEFVLGTPQELAEHDELMKKNPEMEHADPNAITVEPGQGGEVTWTFTKAGAVSIGCLQPGHYDAGMKGQVLVGGSRTAASQHVPTHHGHEH